MKGYLFSFTGILLVILLADQSSCNQQALAAGSAIYPLAAGNYWVYRDSVFTDGSLTTVTNDTDKIVSTADWNGKTTYTFADGKEWYMSGDTIYQLSRQRTGVKFPSPVMMATEKESNFNYVFGGDVVIQKTIVKLPSCSEGKWQPKSCYKIADNCGGYLIVGYGVGIIREKTSECFSGKNNYTSRTLIDMYVK
ncbi:MAG TPA: hypothetical protein PLD84_08575 [Chitinophagales bacterium]|nr:hypothetical protein [Chitinophagales bacterium]